MIIILSIVIKHSTSLGTGRI